METDINGTTQAVYNYGRDLINWERGGLIYYYLHDGLGSTRKITNSVGASVYSYTYDGFGNIIAPGPSLFNYGFTGEQQFNEADGLVFLRARYYKPSFGRFISQDPIRYKGGLNLYQYTNNNPINFFDFDGLCPGTVAEATSDPSFCGKGWKDSFLHHGDDCYREAVPVKSGKCPTDTSGLHCCYKDGVLDNSESHIDPHAYAVGRNPDGSCVYGRTWEHTWDVLGPFIPPPDSFSPPCLHP